MDIIEIDAKGWKSPLDFCQAIFVFVGAPDWNGTSIQAILDLLIWDNLCEKKPPYVMKIKNTSGLSKIILQEIMLLQSSILDARAESQFRRGYDVNVSIEID